MVLLLITGLAKTLILRPDDEPLMSLADVASYVRLPLRTLYDLRRRRIGPPAYRLGRRLVHRRSEVDHWLEQHRDEQEPGR